MTWAVGARLHTTTCSVFCGLRCTLLIDCSAPLATCGGLQDRSSTAWSRFARKDMTWKDSARDQEGDTLEDGDAVAALCVPHAHGGV